MKVQHPTKTSCNSMAEWQRIHDPGTDSRGYLKFLQEESQKWRDANFPLEHRTPELQALGVAEEAGELAHCILKMIQGIRGTEAEHLKAAGDAMGDIIIYLCGLASNLGLDLEQEVYKAWLQVSKRNWVENKVTGILDEKQVGGAGL
jgi:NTP pyrophosphatase (non-canonical NTP hydrolase)